ncbi:MAG: V0D/AC39 family V-type ATPase subunit [Thiotrichales bacterium]
MSAYLNARVSLFAARLLSPQQFDELIRCAEADVATCLAAKGLDYLMPADETKESVEQRIGAVLLREIAVLIRPLRDEQRRFLDYWTQRYEISNLKTLIRGKLMRQRPALIAASLVDMGDFARLPVDALLHAEDLPELFRRLMETPYADLARIARDTFEEHQDPFMLDAMLDKRYHENLVNRAKALEAREGTAFRALMAGLIDRINLMWLVRYRFSYGLPPAQAYYLLVASPYQLHAQRLQQLARQASLAQLIEALPETLRRELLTVETPVQLYAALEAANIALARHTLRSSTSALTRALAYITLRERCLRRVRAVLRGRALGLDTAAIRHAVALEDQLFEAEVA